MKDQQPCVPSKTEREALETALEFPRDAPTLTQLLSRYLSRAKGGL